LFVLPRDRTGRETVIADEICLTLPADDAFHSVAHLVLGGLAARLNLSFENLEDLELALDSLLERPSDGREVTLRVLVEDGELRMIVGPFNAIRAELDEGGADSLNLGRILSAVCDSVEIEDRDGSQWVELTKRLDVLKRSHA
jgi:anti-sigma regulatory factor (Ser/Thr protein kinase)